MATTQGTIDYILDQLSSLRDVSARKMFGEYALYSNGRVVGLVCDNRLFIKITAEGKKFVGAYYQEGSAYKGAKISMVIDEERIEDRDWLCELIETTALHVPVTTKNKKREV